MPQAGKYRHYGVIQTIPTTQSSTGAPIPGTPATFATIWAAIETISGNPYGKGMGEPFGAGRDYSEMTHKVSIRYFAGVIPTMRFQATAGPFSGRAFDILQVDNLLGRNKEMILMCREYRTSATP